MGSLEEGNEYHTLSVKDLLEARDAYHVFLMRKKNVIGTAIGLYRVCKDKTKPRTLKNSEVRSGYSWPCVLVFVEGWVQKKSFGKAQKASYNDYIPKSLYLPDGREIPVCVILSEWGQKNPETILKMKFPGNVIGGGYPIMTKVQGEERWATLGCLVSDGRLTYGLTNAHVTGQPGESLYTIINGNEEEIGKSSSKNLKKIPFTQVYESLPGKHALVNLDIGLIELNDINNVTSQIFGLGKVMGLLDVNHDTLSLKLIGCPVMGFGCSSGLMKGEIIALFYRYETAGGYDYIADYLIGPRSEKIMVGKSSFSPRKGDSGTLLVIDKPKSSEHMKAIGVLWGGQKDITNESEQPYGLATNLGTICKNMDIELVSSWNSNYDTFFGAYAHITLPGMCLKVIKDKKLKTLMENNADRFSLPLEETAVNDTKGLSKKHFVPLSDVPDLVWKSRGGEFQRSKEGPNHFADMDQPNPSVGGKTLLDICENVKNIDPDVWVNFYKELKAKDMGALPFRIAQIYDALVKFARQGHVTNFICAAGILSHYVFDSCMPLHISYMHHGDPDGPKDSSNKSISYNVHAEFDNQMVEYYVETLRNNLDNYVKEKDDVGEPVKRGSIKTTKDAARAAVTLMYNTVNKYANPKNIVKDYEKLVDENKRARCAQLWDKYGEGMQHAMAEAVVLTARLWEAAWDNGNGKNNIHNTDSIPEDDLKKLYETKTGFLDSVRLSEIKGTMTWT